MSNEKRPQPILWFQIRENLATMDDEEIDAFAQSLWQEITQELGDAHES